MKMLEKVGLLLVGIVLVLGLCVRMAYAGGVTISGTVDIHYPNLLTGGEGGTEANDIWKDDAPLTFDKNFLGYHILHPKLTIDISDELSGESLMCFSDHHSPRVWTAFMDYAPFEPEGFGDNPLAIRVGILNIPFGHHAYSYVNMVDMKTIARPLMSPDHFKSGLKIKGAPEPILQMPTSDKGILLYGTKWLREQKDQLWYGAYVVDGISRTDGHPTSHEELDRNRSKHVGGKLSYTSGDLLTVGGSFLIGNWDPAEGKTDYATKGVDPAGGKLAYDIYGLDLHLALPRRANLRFEYMLNPIEWDLQTSGTKKGWYAQLDFPFDLIFENSEVAKKFEFATMYSSLEGTKEKAKGTPYTFNELSRISAGISFMPVPALKYKIEYQFMPFGTPSNKQYGDEIEDVSWLMMTLGLTF